MNNKIIILDNSKVCIARPQEIVMMEKTNISLDSYKINLVLSGNATPVEINYSNKDERDEDYEQILIYLI